MAKAKKVVTTKPAGLTVTRNGNNLILKWKIGASNYGAGQNFRYRFNKGRWVTQKIAVNATSKSIAIPIQSYFPSRANKLATVEFGVQGRQKKYKQTKKGKTTSYEPTWSAFAPATYSLLIPANPSLTKTLNESQTNVCEFGWTLKYDNADRQHFRDMKWESMLVKECGEANGAKLAWNSSALGWLTGTSLDSSTVTITEDTTLLADASYTRWFRARSRGLRGEPGVWAYEKHVYARPYQANVIAASASEDGANGFFCHVEWEATSNEAHPIDQTIVQYCIAVPVAGMECPSGSSWTDANVSADTTNKDAASFSIDDTLSEDECLFVRVNTTHDKNTTYGKAFCAAVGKLGAPEDVSVTTNNTTHRATIYASNTSDVPDSFLAILYRTENNPSEEFVVGVIPAGGDSVTVQCPDWSQSGGISFGVYACVGSYQRQTRADGVSNYAVTEKMISNMVWEGGSVPIAPTNVVATPTDIAGTVRVSWDWTWLDADGAELSWSDHYDAWESTDEPDTYLISNLNAAQWNISGLETGITWYIRVRLMKGNDDSGTYGPYSDIVTIDLSSAPSIPALVLSDTVIPEDGSVTASWAYTTTDGTLQAYAEICEATVSGSGITYGSIIAHTEKAQRITIRAKEVGWQVGEVHALCVRVVSASGHTSDGWSNPVAVTIAEPLVCSIAGTSLQTVTVIDDEEQEMERTVLALTEMPLTVLVTGAGNGGTTTVIVERAEGYIMDRPDEARIIGYEGEAVALIEQTGEAEIEIRNEDLIGLLDDGAKYRIVATIKDGLGQTSQDSQDFEVRWDHQAIMPEAEVSVDPDEMVAFIRPIAPAGVLPGDVCDIYRLSIDKPELIVEGGSWGTLYVDPFPAFGEFGGHRIVFRSVNGDYITEDNKKAWIDLDENDGDYLEFSNIVIDFSDDRVQLSHNITLSNSWAKDFTETKYLGGSVQGDWSPAITRSLSANAVIVNTLDSETAQAMRRLAVYPGICHVRTPEGSSFAADVQVSEDMSYENGGKIASFSIDITRVDPESLDGVLYDDWYVPEEEEE